MFCDYREFLKQLQQTYSQRGDGSEREILEPVLKTQILVLDELGAMKPTKWVMNTVGYVLNTRYNECRTTIITTNYPNLPPLDVDEGMKSSLPFARWFAERRWETELVSGCGHASSKRAFRSR